MHELRMPSDKEIQIQTLGLMCREMTVWKDMGGGGRTSTESAAHLFLFLHGQNIPETPRVQLIHIHRGLMYCHRGDNESLPNRETKGSLMGKLTSGQNIPDSGE